MPKTEKVFDPEGGLDQLNVKNEPVVQSPAPVPAVPEVIEAVPYGIGGVFRELGCGVRVRDKE